MIFSRLGGRCTSTNAAFVAKSIECVPLLLEALGLSQASEDLSAEHQFMNELSAQLKTWREQRGLSIEQAARELGVTSSTMYRWLTAKSKPRGLSKLVLEKALAEPAKQP